MVITKVRVENLKRTFQNENEKLIDTSHSLEFTERLENLIVENTENYILVKVIFHNRKKDGYRCIYVLIFLYRCIFFLI